MKGQQSLYVDEPAKTTPVDSARLNWTEQRTSELQAEVEAMIAAGAPTTAQFGVTGNGITDDTVAMKNFLKACKERQGVMLPGLIKVSAALPVPVTAEVYGFNQRTTQIVREGNGDLFDLEEGAITMKNFRVAALGEQTVPGAAFELVGGGGTDVRLDSITLGSNFYNGFSMIPTALGGSIHISRIRVEDIGAGVKGIKGAAFVLGSSSNRMVGAILEDIQGVALNKAGVAKWLEANNCDSCWAVNVLFQTGTQGIVIGNNDSSAERTTNMQFVNVTCDGGPEGMAQGWFITNAYATDLVGCHGQGAEMYLGENNHGFTMLGGTLQVCQNNGLRLGGAAGFPAEFVAVKFANNNITLPAGTATNPNTSPLCADVQVENGAARALFNACMFGNVMNYGGVCRSYFPIWFTAAATPTTSKIVAANPVWVQGGNSTGTTFAAGSPPAMSAAGIYGFKGASEGPIAVPVPVVW